MLEFFADVLPTASARKAWFPRSLGSHLHTPVSRTVSFYFMFTFLYLGHFLFAAFNVFCYDLVRQKPWFPEHSPRLLGTLKPSVPLKPISFAGMLAAATGCTEALGYTELHLFRPEHALSRPPIPYACLISDTRCFAHVASGKNNYKEMDRDLVQWVVVFPDNPK